MRRYGVGNAHAYSLKAARDHVLWYYEMIDLLAKKLPSVVRVIHYEDMVSDPTSALRAAAELCGLQMPEVQLPHIGDDRECSVSYRQFMAEELAGSQL